MVGIGAGELVVIAIGLLLVVGQLVAVVALIAWGRWVSARVPGAFWSAAAWLPALGMLLQLGGGCAFAAMMVHAFESIGSADAAARASILARSISSAMNVGSIAFVGAIVLYATSVVVFAIGTAKTRAPRGGREV